MSEKDTPTPDGGSSGSNDRFSIARARQIFGKLRALAHADSPEPSAGKTRFSDYLAALTDPADAAVAMLWLETYHDFVVMSAGIRSTVDSAGQVHYHGQSKGFGFEEQILGQPVTTTDGAGPTLQDIIAARRAAGYQGDISAIRRSFYKSRPHLAEHETTEQRPETD